MRLVMNGALGRMGQRILALAFQDPDIRVTGAVDVRDELVGKDIGELVGAGTSGVFVTKSLEEALKNADVVIDFTWPDMILRNAEICAKAGIPLVVGTTGLKKEDSARFKELVANIPCVLAPNMSVGVNILFKIAAEVASILGDDYDVEIMEIHHRFKKDAPSGTANRLAEVIAEALDRNLEEVACYGRKGITGERNPKEIGIHSLRMGDVVGDHTVSFTTLGERIELTHKAHSRDALATGAIRAAKYLLTAKPGLYDMQDVLGLKSL